MVIYSLKDPRIIQNLNNKAKNGVAVTLICDREASAGVEKKLVPQIDLCFRSSKGLMHDKLIIIDKEQVWIGSANFTHDSLKSHFNLMEHLRCPEVAALVLEKALQFKGNHLEKPLKRFSYSISGQKSELIFLPDDQEAVPKLAQLIDSAKKTVRVAMYTFTRSDLAEKLIAAKKRGVDVQVAIDQSTSQNASKKIVQLLNKNKVPLFFNSGNELLHHKYLLVDDKILAHGSANWTVAAFKQNDDCIMIHYDLTKEQKWVVNEAWRRIIASKP